MSLWIGERIIYLQTAWNGYLNLILKTSIIFKTYIVISNKTTREELWSRQQIRYSDIDYDFWKKQRESIQQLSQMSQSCLFTVDVFKCRYDFASENFANTFGYNSSLLATIENQGDMSEERIHPDDRAQMIEFQKEHAQFIYSLPFENRNNYSHTIQMRMLNRKQKYVNVVSRQRVIQKDRNGKAWIILGCMDISPDQTPVEKIKSTVFNLKTGEIIHPFMQERTKEILTKKEKEILLLIRQGYLSKEIAYKLNISIFTVNNHRKNILRKLHANNAIEAINQASIIGLLEKN